MKDVLKVHPDPHIQTPMTALLNRLETQDTLNQEMVQLLKSMAGSLAAITKQLDTQSKQIAELQHGLSGRT